MLVSIECEAESGREMTTERVWVACSSRDICMLSGFHSAYREKVFNPLFLRGGRWLQMLAASLLEAPNAHVFRKGLKRLDLLSTLRIPHIV